MRDIWEEQLLRWTLGHGADDALVCCVLSYSWNLGFLYVVVYIQMEKVLVV